ncbi:glycosyltransferase [Chryseobacterium foetidum]|uniref:glycosyltransferase n=1 Tax=Chryseobacterium foetidum TaxID=2951057 RepID=UPI0021CAA1C1|nr:glycosyltransferase [Chryseobacterium foetidum]
MKVIHCISSIDETTGGPARSITVLVDSLAMSNKIKYIDLLTLESSNPLYKKFENKKINLKFLEPSFLDYSKTLNIELQKKDADLYHGHGIWNLPIHQMAKSARKKSKPYIISVRGMLEPWSMQQNRHKKKLAMILYQHQDLKSATCLHATGQMEVDSIRNLGYKNPIAKIPNGINLDDYPKKEYHNKTNKTILFLSRIHPKKGIEILIEAWQLLDESIKENWKIKIAGNGDQAYINKLKQEIDSKKLADKIDIIGSKFGTEKLESYHNADLFVLPTYSENFGIVVAEALSCGIPVITTKGTPWIDLKDYKAGAWIDVGVDSLRTTLEEFLQKDSSELEQMGKNGRRLVEDKYSIESVGKQFLELYDWIINKTQKPDFVV